VNQAAAIIRVNQAAAIIRLCYPPGIGDQAEIAWRFGWFRSDVLPRIFQQQDAECDVWVWVHPRHKAEIEAMDPRIRTFTVRDSKRLIRHPIRNAHPWGSVHGLPRYPVQLLFGSDDLIGPQFLSTALATLAAMRAPRALVHFQPYKFDVATRQVYDCGISVPHTGEYHYRNDMPSMFQAFRQPVTDSRYTWVWARGHTRMHTVADEVALVPAGHCLLSVHRYNDSTKITGADAPLPDRRPDWLVAA
jgi:hypothetical protein